MKRVLFFVALLAFTASAENAAAPAKVVAVDKAEILRQEARADAEKLRLEAREDAKAAKLEAKLDAEKAKAEELLRRQQIDTRVFRLTNASAEEVANRLNAMWNGEFGQAWKVTKMAIPFLESNSVIVTAPRTVLDACEKAVALLDVPTPQVYIEARFVELGNSAAHRVGINWKLLSGVGVSGKAGLTHTHTESTATGVEDADTTYFNGTLSSTEMALTLSALDETGDTKTFSNPKIIVSSGKKAVVDMTTKYPNVQIAAKKTINNNNESVDLDMKMAEIPGEDKMMFAKEAFFSWGIELEVTPRVSTNGLINVSIVPTISQLDTTQGDNGFVTAGTSSDSDSDSSDYSSRYPIIEMKRLVTEFNVASGTTAVIGGLSKTTEKQVDTGIPLLRKIPLIGPYLFGSKERVKEQVEIIVFVTVGLVDPKAVKADAGLPKNAILGRQYTSGQKLEPGDRPQKNMEGYDSLDLRPLEEQAKDPLNQTPKQQFEINNFNPFKP